MTDENAAYDRRRKSGAGSLLGALLVGLPRGLLPVLSHGAPGHLPPVQTRHPAMSADPAHAARRQRARGAGGHHQPSGRPIDRRRPRPGGGRGPGRRPGPRPGPSAHQPTPASRFSPTRIPAALDVLRHSAAHVLATAVRELFPKAGIGFGPPIEDGFYYDFEVGAALHARKTWSRSRRRWPR